MFDFLACVVYNEFTVTVRARDILVTTQSAQFYHGLHIGLGIVFGGRCLASDDVSYIIRCPLPTETKAVRVQYLPGSPIAVGHGLELDETLVGLCGGCSLPLVRRTTDVQRVVVSDSSWFHECVFVCVSY